MIPAKTAARLAKVCGMFGSSHDGERASAALQAERIVRQDLGMTWEELFNAIDSEPAREWVEPDNMFEAVGVALAWSDALTEWEVNFLRDVYGRRRLTQKQINCINKILSKARTYAQSAGY